MSNWYDNIPKQGILVKDNDNCLHLASSIDVDDLYSSTNDYIDNVDNLTPATIGDWLSLAPAGIDCETKTKIFDLINEAKND